MNDKNNRKDTNNFLLYIPTKVHANWIEKDDHIYLVFEYNKLIERFAAWLVGKPKVSDIKLDKLGTRTWQLIDGSNTVYHIGQTLRQEFGQDCEPLYERLIMFLRYLSRKGWISYKLEENRDEAI